MSLLEMTTARSASLRKPLVVLGLLWLLLAALATISQIASPTPITVEWRTETEVNAAGFNIYRAIMAEGPYTRLNETLIPAEGSATSGAGYVFVDEAVRSGQTYFYRLEDVELDSSAMQHAPLEYTAPRFPWWLPFLVVVSLMMGLILLYFGLRSER